MLILEEISDINLPEQLKKDLEVLNYTFKKKLVGRVKITRVNQRNQNEEVMAFGLIFFTCCTDF